MNKEHCLEAPSSSNNPSRSPVTSCSMHNSESSVSTKSIQLKLKKNNTETILNIQSNTIFYFFKATCFDLEFDTRGVKNIVVY